MVASKLLSPSVGMVSGCALLIDYLLTITLSVASGADALFNFLPKEFFPYRLSVAVIGVILLIWLNLRGVKEAVAPLVPIFLLFICTHVFAIGYTIITHLLNISTVINETAVDVSTTGNFTIIRLFSGVYKNFVFVQIGMLDSGTFKETEEMECLKKHIREDCDKYVRYMKKHEYYAESFTSIAVDAIDEAVNLAPKIIERFPDSIFYAGRLVFPEDSFFSRWLHNYSAFAMQRRFYHRGIPIVILPIRV